MKKTETNKPNNQPCLFKAELKFIDFWRVSHHFLNTTNLSEKTRTESKLRIHHFSIQLAETISLYPLGHKKVNQKTYDAIASGLNETLRRVKISLALNTKHSKVFIAYWKFLADVLKKDALLLKDKQLQNIIHTFETNTASIKVK